MDAFQIHVSEKDARHVLIKTGRELIGGSSALSFAEQIHRLLQDGVQTFSIELSDLDLINSSGLGMLVAGYSTVRKAGGTFTLCRVPEKVLKLLSVTYLDSVLQVAPDDTAVLEHFPNL